MFNPFRTQMLTVFRTVPKSTADSKIDFSCRINVYNFSLQSIAYE